MKLVSFLKNGNECAGIYYRERVYDLFMMNAGMPGSMNEILSRWDETYPLTDKAFKGN
jgi:hypothetical protein